MTEMTKTCTKCGELKPKTEFNKRDGSRDGLQYQCKSCRNIASSTWRATNPAYNSAWVSINHEKAKANVSKWHADHPEANRIYCQNRRARKRENGGELSSGLSEHLFKLQRGKCACGCKQPLGDDYHLDHRMPLALGGSNTDDNMQLLRSLCNKQKHAKHPVDFMQERGFLL